MEKDGILLDPENTKVWKESLEHLFLESEELRTRMGEEGRKNLLNILLKTTLKNS